MTKDPEIHVKKSPLEIGNSRDNDKFCITAHITKTIGHDDDNNNEATPSCNELAKTRKTDNTCDVRADYDGNRQNADAAPGFNRNDAAPVNFATSQIRPSNT